MSKVLAYRGSAGLDEPRSWRRGGSAGPGYLLVIVLFMLLGPRLASADAIVTTHEVAQMVRLEDVDERDGEIFGYVANHSDQHIYRVILLIRYHWHWHNEFRPGEDDPSRHEELTLTELIPPGGRIRFSYRSPTPVSERTDGELLPTVSIASVQAYEKRAVTAVPAAVAKPVPAVAPEPAQTVAPAPVTEPAVVPESVPPPEPPPAAETPPATP
jgi:hypothetical protein